MLRRSRPRDQSQILGYHRVQASQPDSFGLSVTPNNFINQLLHLSRSRQVVSLKELLLTRPPRGVAITFDDGYSDNLDLIGDLLQGYGMTATLFICPGSLDQPYFWWDRLEQVLFASIGASTRRIDLANEELELDLSSHLSATAALHSLRERLVGCDSTSISAHLADLEDQLDADLGPGSSAPLTEGQLAELARSPAFEIGAHTIHHPLLSTLSIEEQRREIQGSRQVLQEITGQEVGQFAYPYGDFDWRTVGLVEEAGFYAACTVEQGPVFASTDPYLLPRLVIRDWTGEELIRQMDRCY